MNAHAHDSIGITKALTAASDAAGEVTVAVGIFHDGEQRILHAIDQGKWRQSDSAYWQCVAIAWGWVEDGQWVESDRGTRPFWTEEDEYGRVSQHAGPIAP